ncbi:DUF2489 domain-containing protein [Pseudoalteromonas tunicata]|jgi:hypothetical protein|uniref:DUF2489 domain-containing protein n=1 Tax=Pseudoalteromonas tunicata D2 TaxID=87626 RepID=A4CEP0_9GAMM|nr:DUF2489 domain-containing protein [Pseudoalteromonas tunicata]ATC96033.1 hypothetical protein PTUN_a3757 [Pseudoalteromonas tunicata]AXT31562.1 DUF2489 domain-containing protein [Pseudoalteromonas tunicata]EAR26769.1 hypothetical protein PTD2_16531 [Pseudoalteromonas tunicata D2]MDP4985265.1 DUF2489 domain-containing protein [Pseudoalteromonas tunicata]MDP5213304.1 DUF2489 domain-containing protein [Pseudoalteromonas tunicata]
MSVLLIVSLILGAIIIAGLAFYAGRLLLQVKVQNEKVAEKKAQYQAQQAQKNLKLSDSINLIAKAMKEKQCEYSEGCLRIWVLMSQYQFEQEQDLALAYPGVFKMYDAVKEMPTHQARKKYSKKEIFQQDSLRWRKEEEFEAEIMQDLVLIIERFPADPATKTVI